MEKKQFTGHIMAAISVVIWGTTFNSSKILLEEISQIELLLLRFVIGYIILWIMSPRKMEVTDRKHELYFAGAGLTGICLYYLFENVALLYTQASNVGVITSISPFFIGISAHLFLKDEKLKKSFFVGFVFAIVGIAMISFSGQDGVRLNFAGDMLSVVAAMMWGLYAILARKAGDFGYPVIPATRRMFFYGILMMLPLAFVFGFDVKAVQFGTPGNLLNLLYLSVGACAVCFVTWNRAVEILGAIKTSVYIYLIPVITIITSIVVLHEKITWMSAAGTVLTMTGVIISERMGNAG